MSNLVERSSPNRQVDSFVCVHSLQTLEVNEKALMLLAKCAYTQALRSFVQTLDSFFRVYLFNSTGLRIVNELTAAPGTLGFEELRHFCKTIEPMAIDKRGLP